MWRRFFDKPAPDAGLEEELQAHLEIEIQQLTELGMAREQAEAEARRRFGNRARVLEDSREIRGHGGLDRFWHDLRYGARVLRRSPPFTTAAVLSLALGIGATTAVFSIADTIFLRPLPYADAGRLFWVAVRFHDGLEFVASPDYVAWRRDNRVFEQLAATQANLGDKALLGGAAPVEVHAIRVSANFLDTFATAPLLGRTFTAEEELPDGPRTVLVTHKLWRDYFHERRDVIGSVVTLDSRPHTIIGILPPSFVFPADVKVDVLTTLPVSPTASHRDRSMATWAVFGRLKPGVTPAQARADLDLLFAGSKAEDPQMFRTDTSLVFQPLQEHRAGNVRALVFILMGAAACLLAIACANVANLLLARWSARAKELAVRAAIGAARGRLARQLFTEVALLIAASTAAAMILVVVALRSFVYFAARQFPRLAEVSVDYRPLGIALLISLSTAVLFGALPAQQAGRIDLQTALQQAGRGGGSAGHRLVRRSLVAVEVALSVVLLSGATLLFETLWHMQNDRLGFQPEHVLTVSIPLPGKTVDGPGREALASDVSTYLRRLPGTEAVAITHCSPLTGGSKWVTFTRSDRPRPEPWHRGDSIAVCETGADYLKAAGTRLLQGRFLTEDDFLHPGTVAVLNETAARDYFPGESPLGKQVLGWVEGWKTVVGVVADTRNQGLNRSALPEVFVNDTGPADTMDLLFLIRTLASESIVAKALQEEMQAKHYGLFTKTETLDAAMGQLSAGPRFNTVLVSTFAAIAFLMSIVGVYGVLAFSVAQRRQEIGIRMALGATPKSVLRLVMREGAVLVSVGVIAGVFAALALARYLTTLLYGVTATDPGTYAAVVLGLALAAAAASFLPARRAAVVDPLVALRHE